MEFSVTTHQIQWLMMSVMFSDVSTFPEEEKQRISDTLEQMNKLCSDGNNYTLQIEVAG